MEKQFVTYEIAKKLKDLGFKEPCLSYYQPNIECKVNQFFVSGDEPEFFEDNFDLITLAPLWQQALIFLQVKLENEYSGIIGLKIYSDYSGHWDLKTSHFAFTNLKSACSIAIDLINR